MSEPSVEVPGTLEVDYVELDQLRTFHANPRRGDTARIAASLRVNGQYRPIVGNRGTHTGRPNEVLAGNHTLTAMRDLLEDTGDERWARIAVVWRDVDEDQAKRIVLADNRTADVGGYDETALVGLLGGLDDLEGTGYDLGDFEALEASLDAGLSAGADSDDDKVLKDSDKAAWPVIRVPVPPELYERWKTLPGDGDLERIELVLDTLGC